jgi:hypothetical protein
MKFDTVPGNTLRDEQGKLFGYKCPISKKHFISSNAEREQYHHTLALMEEYGSLTASIGEYRQWWLYQRKS